MRSIHETITSRIPRTELIGLLDTMTPFENQRVTAEMEAVDVVEIVSTMPAELITTQPFELIDEVEPDEQPAGSTTSSLDFVVRFVSHAGSPLAGTPAPQVAAPATEKKLPSWTIVVASGAVTLLLGCLTMAAA